MNNRLEVDDILRNLPGNPHVYFQPPTNLIMEYPAIRYERADVTNNNADNLVHHSTVSYQVIVIDKDPDSVIVDALNHYVKADWQRHYVKDNLNHDVYRVYE